jgi:hypothetical protein
MAGEYRYRPIDGVTHAWTPLTVSSTSSRESPADRLG